jgi:hypothetical protein
MAMKLGSRLMPYYYAYQVDDDGHIIGRFNLYAENDEEAVAKARQCQADRNIEIWDFDRKVSFLKRPD